MSREEKKEGDTKGDKRACAVLQRLWRLVDYGCCRREGKCPY